MMKLDVTLLNTQEKLILACQKFYRRGTWFRSLAAGEGSAGIISRDSFLRDEPGETGASRILLNACGALVSPTVDEDFDFSYRY